jgi:hypothetical protein
MKLNNEIRNTVYIVSALLALLLAVGNFMFYGRAAGEVLHNEVVNIKEHLQTDLEKIDLKLDRIIREQ